MNRIMRPLLYGLGVVALAACSPKLTTHEGFPTLYVSPDNGNVLVFARPDLDFSHYRKVSPLQSPVPMTTDVSSGPRAAEEY